MWMSLPPLLWGQGLYPDVDSETGLWGYRDDSAAWRIAPQYHAAGAFGQGLAVVTLDELRYLSPEGVVFPAGHRVRGTRPWRPQAVIGPDGATRWRLPTGYEVPAQARFGAGRLPVRSPAGRWGYLDRRGRVSLPLRWARTWSFAQGWAAVQVPAAQLDSLYYGLPGGLQTRFDRELRQWRRLDLPPDLRRAHPQGGLSVVFIDSLGRVQQVLPVRYVPPEGNRAFRFEEGYLPVAALPEGGMGLLDQALRVALPCHFEQLGLMHEGYVFAVNRPAYQLPDVMAGLEPASADTLFVGYLNPAGLAAFSLSPGFLDGSCRYRVEGLPMRRGQGLIWLHPLYCEQRVGLRVSAQGELLEYFELPPQTH